MKKAGTAGQDGSECVSKSGKHRPEPTGTVPLFQEAVKRKNHPREMTQYFPL